MKYYLIAGEASGDLHGSYLMNALSEKDPQAEFRAWGGDLMEESGAVLVKHIKELAFMGFWEVITHLFTILNNIKSCKKDILDYQPDVILYIDYPGFNLRIAQWAKSQGFKNHYYISPQVWAWKENRVVKMKQCLDALYVILPFEKLFFEKKHQFPVDFVGHPLMDSIPQRPVNKSFFEQHQLTSNQPLIALLPGSRMQEIKKILPLFILVSKQFPKHQFIIAGAPGLEIEQYKPFIKNTDIKVVHGATYDLLQNSTAALVTSGTATLETALFEVPQMVCYRTSTISYWIGKRIVKLPFISLVNLILNKEVVKELIQKDCSLKNLSQELKRLLNSEEQKKIKKEYHQLKILLGEGGASEKAASLIYQRIQ